MSIGKLLFQAYAIWINYSSNKFITTQKYEKPELAILFHPLCQAFKSKKNLAGHLNFEKRGKINANLFFFLHPGGIHFNVLKNETEFNGNFFTTHTFYRYTKYTILTSFFQVKFF